MLRRAIVSRVLVTLLVGMLVLAMAREPLEREAGACSCVGPQTALLGPDRIDDAPLNAKVRLDTPAAGSGSTGVRTVLRVHHGSEAPSTSRTIAPGGWLSTIELSPTGPLTAATRYEVALVDATQVPDTTVIGTFRTGSAPDTTAPRIDAMGPAIAFKNTNPMGSACQVAGPWVVIEGVRAEDPGRPEAQLVFGVWLADASGTIDPKKPPTAVVSARDGTLHIGQTSLCDPHGFPMPKSPAMLLGIAALDEAGNASALRRVRVDLAGARHP
jgi:hypothetical protein